MNITKRLDLRVTPVLGDPCSEESGWWQILLAMFIVLSVIPMDVDGRCCDKTDIDRCQRSLDDARIALSQTIQKYDKRPNCQATTGLTHRGRSVDDIIGMKDLEQACFDAWESAKTAALKKSERQVAKWEQTCDRCRSEIPLCRREQARTEQDNSANSRLKPGSHIGYGHIGEDRKICGPDISALLVRALEDVRADFLSGKWSRQQKEDLCDAIRSHNPLNLPTTLMAWDICELYLPYTGWLQRYFGSCGVPRQGSPGKPEIEDEARSPCGNSVQVGAHCYLAGTVNYAFLGQISRLCHDEFPDRLDVDEMTRLIWKYKAFSKDDPNPPSQWARWAYFGRPITDLPVGRGANRDECETSCEYPAEGHFRWRWLPYQENCPRW